MISLVDTNLYRGPQPRESLQELKGLGITDVIDLEYGFMDFFMGVLGLTRAARCHRLWGCHNSFFEWRKSKMKNFEMAKVNDPEDIILATQRAVCRTMRGIISDLKSKTKNPGLTWEQLEYFIDNFEKRKPTIIRQESEL